MLFLCYDVVMGTMKELREKAFLSQRDLAAKTGMAISTINRLEHGLQTPIPRTIRKIAAALGVEPSAISW